jgi:hypothetical protein
VLKVKTPRRRTPRRRFHFTLSRSKQCTGWNPTKLHKKKAPKKGREKRNKGARTKVQAKQTAQKRRGRPQGGKGTTKNHRILHQLHQAIYQLRRGEVKPIKLIEMSHFLKTNVFYLNLFSGLPWPLWPRWPTPPSPPPPLKLVFMTVHVLHSGNSHRIRCTS